MPRPIKNVTLKPYDDIYDAPGVGEKPINFSKNLVNEINKSDKGKYRELGVILEITTSEVKVSRATKSDFANFIKAFINKFSHSPEICDGQIAENDLYICKDYTCPDEQTCKAWLMNKGLEKQYYICICQ